MKCALNAQDVVQEIIKNLPDNVDKNTLIVKDKNVDFVKNINETYNSAKYDDIVKVNKTNKVLTLTINPNAALVNDMNKQNENDSLQQTKENFDAFAVATNILQESANRTDEELDINSFMQNKSNDNFLNSQSIETLKTIEILQSDKAKKLFNTDKSLQEILNELGVNEQQQELIDVNKLDSNQITENTNELEKNNKLTFNLREQIITNLLAKTAVVSEVKNDTQFQNISDYTDVVSSFEKMTKEQQVAFEKTIRDLAAKLSDRIGIKSIVINDKSKKFKGKIEHNIAIVNLAYCTKDTSIHEILGHPIIRAIKDKKSKPFKTWLQETKPELFKKFSKKEYDFYSDTNKDFEDFVNEITSNYIAEHKDYLDNKQQLYQNLLKELEYGKGLEVLDRIKKDYKYKEEKSTFYTITEEDHENGKFLDNEVGNIIAIAQPYTLEEQQEEAIVELLSMMTADKLDALKDGKLISLLKKLLKEVKEFVKSLLNQREIEIDKLPNNLTLDDLANILAYSNSNLILPGYEVIYTTSDNNKFKTYQEASNHISELTINVKDVDLDDIKIDTENKKSYWIKSGKNSEIQESGLTLEEANKKIEIFNKNLDEYTPLYFIEESKFESSNQIVNFIEKNKKYEQSKEIIDIWKKENDIVYDPQEVYSRGRKFYHTVGAFITSFDPVLMMQNYLAYLQDYERVGAELIINGFSRTENSRVSFESKDEDLRIVIYPTSEDIKWVTEKDAFSGTTRQDGKNVSEIFGVKKNELIGIGQTKAPTLNNLKLIATSLAEAIYSEEKWANEYEGTYNEIGLRLTGKNFRFEYDENTPYQQKKTANKLNKILDEKFGEIIEPEISRQVNKEVYNIYNERKKIQTFNTLKEAEDFLKENRDDIQENGITLNIVKEKQIGKQPVNKTLKSSISDVEKRIIGKTFDRGYGEFTTSQEPNITDISDGGKDKRYLDEPFKLTWDNEEGKLQIQLFKTLKEAEDKKQKLLDTQFKNKKEYTEQALINTKIAALNKIPKKYHRSLIRSEVKQILDDYNYPDDATGGFEIDEVFFQKMPNNADSNTKKSEQKLKEEDNNQELLSQREQQAQEKANKQNAKRPVTDNPVEYSRYKEALLLKVTNDLKNLNKDKRNPNKDVKKIISEISRLNNVKAVLKKHIETLRLDEIELIFEVFTDDIAYLSTSLDNTENFDIENFKSMLDFLYKMIKGVSYDNTEQTNIEHIKSINHPAFENVSLALDELNLKYKAKLETLKLDLLNQNVFYVNNVANNKALTEEDIKNMFYSSKDINFLEKTFLGIGESSNNDTIIPKAIKTTLETKLAIREAEVKIYKDKLQSLIKKIGVNSNFDFIFETLATGVKTGNIINYYTPKFNADLSVFYSISKNKELTKQKQYLEKLEWIGKNAELIDFTKIKAIQNIYGGAYAGYFTSSEKEMDTYESSLKEKLGVMYEDELNKVLNDLEVFEESKESIMSSPSIYKKESVAKINPWAFMKHYKSSERSQMMDFETGSGNAGFVYSEIANIRFIPKKEIFVTVDEEGQEIYLDSRYYNKDFYEMTKNNDKLEYWRLLNEIYSQYVNPTYQKNYMQDLSYAKFEETWIENIAAAKGMTKGVALYNEAKKGFKTMFYEKGYKSDNNEIKSNYKDASKGQIKQLTDVLMQMTKKQIVEMAILEGVDKNGTKENMIKDIANKKILSKYSTDINKVTSALLDMTALQKAKEDTLPIANLFLDIHRLGKRQNSTDKLESWVDRVIKNQREKYRGSVSFLGQSLTEKTLFGTILDKFAKIPFVGRYINKEAATLLTGSEKELLKYLKLLQETGHNKTEETKFVLESATYSFKIKTDPKTDTEKKEYFKIIDKKVFLITEEEFEENFKKHIGEKISNIGLDLNTAGVIQGILKLIILKTLALNPLSGIFNRVEGKNSALIMDATGKLWTQGNVHAANSFLQFANFINFLPERLTPEQNKKINELKKLRLFLKYTNLIQDRKNELDKNENSSKVDLSQLTDIYQFAVGLPEFKTQGSVFLAVLMDIKIQDDKGNFVAIFDGQGFPAHNMEGEKLVLKPEFRSPSNISNWENFKVDEINLKNNQYLLTRNKIQNAISRSQGNYDNLDVIDATKNIWGRAMTLFTKWLPEHYMQRFSSGKNFDLVTGKSSIKGRYRYLWANNPALLSTGVISLFTAFGMTPVTGLIGLGFTGVVIAKYFKDIYSKKNIKNEATSILEFVAFTKSVVVSTLNYPMEILSLQKPLIKQSVFNKYIPDYEKLQGKTNMSIEEIRNLQAIAKELAIKLTLLSVMLVVKGLTWDSDDDDEDDKRQLHNFLDNQLSRIISSLSVWTNPEAFLADAQRFAFLKYLWDIGSLMQTIITLNEDDKGMDNFYKVIPLPKLLYKGTMPYHDVVEYNNSQWQDKVVKDYKTNGEWSNKIKYEKLKKERKEELKQEYKDKGYKDDKLDRAVNRALRKQYPYKKEKDTYKNLLEKIKGK